MCRWVAGVDAMDTRGDVGVDGWWQVVWVEGYSVALRLHKVGCCGVAPSKPTQKNKMYMP